MIRRTGREMCKARYSSKRKMGQIIWLLSILFLALGGWGNRLTYAQQRRWQVFYLNSYHHGYKFSDDILSGIESAFRGQAIDLRVEYLDTKHISDSAYLESVYRLYKQKYANTRIDLIISSDDAALNFLFKYADDLFPGIPVVFCGANFFDDARLQGHERFTGVSEEIDLRKTLDLALALHPQTRRVAFVNDMTVTGQRIHEQMVKIVPEYPQIEFIYLENVTMAELRRRLGELPTDSVVLLTLFFRDQADEFFEYDVFTRAVAESSAVPVYGSWDFSLGLGIVGGWLTSGYTEGERAAQIALRVLRGEQPREIPVVHQVSSRPMFDYVQMTRWKIKPSMLPPDSVVINRPFSFYETYKVLVWVIGTSLVVLIIIVTALTINVLRRRKAEIRLNESNRELQAIRISLDQRVTEQTAELSRRVLLLQAATDVSLVVSTLHDPDELLKQVVDLIRERFDLYYVGIFLLDETGRWAVLRSGTGEFGRQMLAQNHRLEVGGVSMIGQCVARNRVILAQDVGEEILRFKNPLLPDTRSEMAVPMRVAGQVVGAVTVQSMQENAFEQVYIDVVQIMADQLALAVQNAQLLAQAQRTAQALERIQQRYFAQTWDAFVEEQEIEGVLRTPEGLHSLSGELLPEVSEAIAYRQPLVRNRDGKTTLVLPIFSRGLVVGALGFSRPLTGESDESLWSQEDLLLAQTIGEQFALAADNLRLLDQTQRRAARERLVRQVADRMRAALDWDELMQTTLQEIARAVGAARAFVQWVPEEL